MILAAAVVIRADASMPSVQVTHKQLRSCQRRVEDERSANAQGEFCSTATKSPSLRLSSSCLQSAAAVGSRCCDTLACCPFMVQPAPFLPRHPCHLSAADTPHALTSCSPGTNRMARVRRTTEMCAPESPRCRPRPNKDARAGSNRELRSHRSRWPYDCLTFRSCSLAASNTSDGASLLTLYFVTRPSILYRGTSQVVCLLVPVYLLAAQHSTQADEGVREMIQIGTTSCHGASLEKAVDPMFPYAPSTYSRYMVGRGSVV